MASSAAPSPDAVSDCLRALLPTLDMDVTTERQIRGLLSAQLGPVDGHHALITGVIEAFLEELDDGAAQAEAEPAAVTPSAGSKRKAEAAPGANRPKAGKVGSSGSSGDGLLVPLTKNRRLSVGMFQSKLNVGLREYYEKDGQWLPGKKGLAMSTDEWDKLRVALPQLEAALTAGNAALAVDLGRSRRAYISEFKGTYQVHVREMYMKDRQLAPGLKGVTLDAEALRIIMAHAEAVDAHIAAAAGGGGAGPGGEAAPPTPASTSAAAAAPGVPPAESVPDAAGGGTAGTSAGDGGSAAPPGGSREDGLIELGALKFASFSTFKGQSGIDLRTYYEKNGQMLPGTKGIRLSAADWHLLTGAAQQIDAAMAAGNTAYVLPLSNKRKATVSDFKSNLYVNVREYYEKDGELKPGAKGCSMAKGEWGKLKSAFPLLDAKLP